MQQGRVEPFPLLHYIHGPVLSWLVDPIKKMTWDQNVSAAVMANPLLLLPNDASWLEDTSHGKVISGDSPILGI